MSNADEIAYWNGDSGARWALFQERIDAAFAPLTAAGLAFAAPVPGESALDIGCGCGETAIAIASLVGDAPTVGIDISRPMLAVAESRARAAGLVRLRFLASDASTHVWDEPAFDLAFSRFGVMFFDDPVAAFTNLHRALAPQARLVFVCWRSLAENPWFHVPLGAIDPLVPPLPRLDPHAPGPMAFADPDRVRDILASAGFHDIELEAFDAPLPFGSRAAAADFLVQIGPTHRRLADVDDNLRHDAIAAIDEALRAHETAAGVALGAGVWLVRSRA